MNRIRSIKPELRRHRRIADCGLLASLLSRDLITYADDQGRFRATGREVKAECLPYFDTIKPAEVEKALQALEGVGFIELYEVDGEQYGWMPKWFKHQRLQADRMTWSDLPPPPSFKPEGMPSAILKLWLKADSDDSLPVPGDGTLRNHSVSNLVPNGLQGGPGADTPRNQSGASAESIRAQMEPRARASAGSGAGGERSTATDPPTPRSVEEVSGRAQGLKDGCEEILARPLTSEERDIVLGWASRKRGGELPALEVILDEVRAEMARPTPDGRPAYGLKWAANGVSTVFRANAPRSSANGRPARDADPNFDISPDTLAQLRALSESAVESA